MKADEYATKKERLSWLGRTGKTVQVSIDGMDKNGRNKGIVYEHLVFSRRVLKSFYRREVEIEDDIQPEDEIEIPKEVPTALPWDEK